MRVKNVIVKDVYVKPLLCFLKDGLRRPFDDVDLAFVGKATLDIVVEQYPFPTSKI